MKKKKTKRSRRTSPLTKAICWLIILACMGGIAYGLKWTWDSCAEYQANSAKTLVYEEMDKLSEYLGLELSCNMIPKTGEGDDFIYTLTSEKKAVAAVTLTKIKSGLLGLALFEKKGIQGLQSFEIILPVDAEIYVSGDKYQIPEDSPSFKLQTSSGASYFGYKARSYRKVLVENIYDFSQLSIWDGDAKTILCPYKKSYLAVRCFESDAKESIVNAAKKCTENYAHYMSNDLPYYQLAANIIGGAPITGELSQMKVLWFGDHTMTEMVDYRISEPFDVGSGFALVNAQFTYRVYETGGNIQDDDIKLTLFMKQSSGTWKAADIISYVEYTDIFDWDASKQTEQQ